MQGTANADIRYIYICMCVLYLIPSSEALNPISERERVRLSSVVDPFTCVS